MHINGKLLCLLMAILLAVSPALAVAQGDGVTVTDMKGREIALDAPATRIVALAASDVEILYAIGAGDALVGRGEYCDYPAEALEKPSVQSGYETNLEQIVALEPQVVIMNTMGQSLEQVSALEKAGIAVIASEATDIDGVYDAIALIGAVTGRNDEAQAVVDSMRAELETLRRDAPHEGTKTVYFEVSPLEYGLWTAGAGTFMNELCVLMGLKNCFEDVEGWAEISEEQVLERSPDIIVTLSPYYGEGITPEQEIAGRAGWGGVSAVRDGRLLRLGDNELTRPAPRLCEGARRLYDIAYGE